MKKKLIKQFLVGIAAFSAVSMSASDKLFTTGRNFFMPRAFSANLAREMLMEGWEEKDTNSWCGKFSVAPAYQRSWHQTLNTKTLEDTENVQNGLALYPFWSGTGTMISSDNVGGGDLDVYQFGLGGTVSTNGSISINPLVYQAGADLMLIIQSSPHASSFFAKVKAPVGVYNINLQLTESAPTLETPYYDAGQIALNSTTTYQLASTMTQAFAGNLPSGQETGQGNFTPMQYGLINGDISTGARFGDMEMTVGYRFISQHQDIFTIGIRASAPTGNKATGIYMLEPIFGRDGHWGLGGYADAHVNLWEGSHDNYVQMKFMANAMHLFSAQTVRSYDLTANGAGSKYLLVGTYPNGSYQNKIANLLNYTTLESASLFGIEGDMAVSFAYTTDGWSFDAGYEFWGRSAETLTITGQFPNQVFAILGRQFVSTTGNVQANYCQPFAQINFSESTTTQPTAVNPDTTTIAVNQSDVVNPILAGNRIAIADINITDAQQHASFTSKVFSKITYEWQHANYPSHLGLMGECEFSTCLNNALPQWSIALIGGVSF